jgi:hypothetical protein
MVNDQHVWIVLSSGTCLHLGGRKISQASSKHEVYCAYFLRLLGLRQYVPPKCRWTSARLQSATSLSSPLHRHSRQNLISIITVICHVGFEVLTVVLMKSTILWDITQCSPLGVNFCMTPAFKMVSWWIYCFDPEDGSDMFLRNLGWPSTTTRRYIPEDCTLHLYTIHLFLNKNSI